MGSLRKVYEEQTEKAKQEFMYLHSAKVSAVVLSLRVTEVPFLVVRVTGGSQCGAEQCPVRQDRVEGRGMI